MNVFPYDPERDVPNFIKQFVIAVRRRSLTDQNYAATSDASRTKLLIEINIRLAKKENRVPVLQAITGIPITSQKLLTQGYTSVLIDEVINVSKNHPATISLIERLLESRTSLKAWELFPWERPQGTHLPDLQPDNPPPF